MRGGRADLVRNFGPAGDSLPSQPSHSFSHRHTFRARAVGFYIRPSASYPVLAFGGASLGFEARRY